MSLLLNSTKVIIPPDAEVMDNVTSILQGDNIINGDLGLLNVMIRKYAGIRRTTTPPLTKNTWTAPKNMAMPLPRI